MVNRLYPFTCHVRTPYAHQLHRHVITSSAYIRPLLAPCAHPVRTSAERSWKYFTCIYNTSARPNVRTWYAHHLHACALCSFADISLTCAMRISSTHVMYCPYQRTLYVSHPPRAYRGRTSPARVCILVNCLDSLTLPCAQPGRTSPMTYVTCFLSPMCVPGMRIPHALHGHAISLFAYITPVLSPMCIPGVHITYYPYLLI
jgi:hypothetical protein